MTDATSAAAAATDNRKVWQKNGYDVADQTTSNATSAGFLRKDDSRVDIISTMDKGIKQQVFSFQNVTGAATQLTLRGKGLRVQLLGAGGNVVADSKPGMGAASDAYASLVKGAYTLRPGQYYVVVKRDQGTPTDTQIGLNLQVRQGTTVKNDYITQAMPEPANLQHAQAVAAVQQVAPTVATAAQTGLFGANSSDPFGQGGYNIFGQKTYS